MRIFSNKFLLFIMFFIFFFNINVKAATLSDKYTVIKYKEEYIEPMNNFLNSTLYDNLISYVSNNMTNQEVYNNVHINFTNNYIMYISLNNFSSSSTRIAVSFSSGFSYIDGSIWYDGYENGRMWLYNNTTYRFYFYFDSNYNITSVTQFNQGGYNTTYSIYNDTETGNYVTYPDYPIYIDKTFYSNTSATIRFPYNNGNALTNIPIKIFDTIYTPRVNNDVYIPSLDYIDSLNSSLDTSNTPEIFLPQIIYNSNYAEVEFIIHNYTYDSSVEGYFVRIVNNTNGTVENIAPEYNEPDQILKRKYYENSNISLQVHDREYNIIAEQTININLNYNEQSNYNIIINYVNNDNKRIDYTYIIKNDNNVKCFYSINNGNFIENSNCLQSNNIYSIYLTNNGNVTWQIRDLENNVIYTYNQNFIFNNSETYINFIDNYNNNFLNLNVLINRYQVNDIVEYSINNNNYVIANLEDYSSTQSIKNFIINNLNNGDIVKVRVKRNNEVITYSEYKVNYIKYDTSSDNNFNLTDFFKNLDINNINTNLKNYIKYIGDFIINSKLGNLIILEFFIMIVCFVLKVIRR